METEIRLHPERSCYELLLDGQVVGLADYVERGDAVEIPHTEIEPEQQGKGLAAVMVAAVLDDLRSKERLVIPTCSYVRAFIRRHPQYEPMLAPTS